MRLSPTAALSAVLVSGVALAHSGAGMRQLNPGDPIPIYEMKALVQGEDGIYRPGVVNLNKVRDGGALLFMAIDPVVKSQLTEARKLLALLKTLHNTHVFFVLPPGRSMRPADIAPAVQQANLGLPFIIDDRDYFPFAFQYGLGETPRYQLFDQTQTLVIRGASSLSQRMPSHLTFAQCIRALDEGKVIPQATFASHKTETSSPPPEQ
jgi:hypothetical protein